jgi:DNA-nicking Smr family endonuclease
VIDTVCLMIKKTDNFLDAMHDVQPLNHEKRVSLGSRAIDRETINIRQQAAQSELPISVDPLDNAEIQLLQATAELAFQRPGVQHGVYKKLRLGKYVLEARLDLHNMTVAQARTTLYEFVHDCISHDIRCALITHGKGEGRATPAVLKSNVAHWLPQIESVLAFHSAQKRHGGSGATYLLLKKSERQRQDDLSTLQNS